jgi:hypothetical protein
MKLKNKVIGTVLSVIASSFVFISVPELANAAECSAADPCSTYAMLDSSGVVINIIVCQPSVCGSGQFAGHRVVLQVAANPQTNDTTGTGGYTTNLDQGVVVTLSNDNVFTVKKDEVVTQTISVPEVQTQNTNNTTTVTTTSIQAQFIDTNTVKVDATQTNNSNTTMVDSTTNNVNTVTENIVFEERKTEQEVSVMLVERNFNLLLSKINRLLALLDGWIKK